MRSATRAGWLKFGGKLYDAVAEAHAFGALAGGGEEDLGGAGMRILLQEMMLHFPDGVEAQTIGEPDLFERVAERFLLGAFGPRARHLVLVEESEAHISRPPRRPSRRTKDWTGGALP